MRGKRQCVCFAAVQRRITPADAGKTSLELSYLRKLWDHPRRCGENDGKWGKKSQFAGSPPQMRGKLATASSRAFKRGITPADAGKTLIDEIQTEFNRDHPRRCGENHSSSRFGIR